MGGQMMDQYYVLFYVAMAWMGLRWGCFDAISLLLCLLSIPFEQPYPVDLDDRSRLDVY